MFFRPQGRTEIPYSAAPTLTHDEQCAIVVGFRESYGIDELE
jgi:hypothetical protein